MNPIEDQLERLLHVAATSERSAKTWTPPFGLETRVMSAWRNTEPLHFWNTGLLVRGLILASAIMALSLWPVLSKGSNPYSDYLQLADSSLQANSSP